ncbi:MAG: hypothetical protein ACJAQZ_004204, partial [Planctomycetota bacterium]
GTRLAANNAAATIEEVRFMIHIGE